MHYLEIIVLLIIGIVLGIPVVYAALSLIIGMWRFMIEDFGAWRRRRKW